MCEIFESCCGCVLLLCSLRGPHGVLQLLHGRPWGQGSRVPEELYHSGHGLCKIVFHPIIVMLSAATCKYLQLPANTCSYLQIPAAPLQIPAAPCKYLQLPAATCKYLQLLANSCSSLQIPAAPCSYRQLPAATCKYLQLPAFTCSYTNTHRSRPMWNHSPESLLALENKTD